VLIGRTKVCGSAQRRGAPGTPGHGAVLQHGSLLWRTSPAAPELPGVEDLTNHPVDVEDAAALWLGGLTQQLALGWQSDDLDTTEVCRAETLAKTRYSGDDWTKNRGRGSRHGQETL